MQIPNCLAALAFAAAIGTVPAVAQERTPACFVLCTPSLAIEPTVTIENLARRHRIQDVASGTVTRVDRGAEFEVIVAAGIPTTIPRVSLTFEAIWTPFAETERNVSTGASAEDLGKSRITDNPVELEFELNLHVLRPERTAGWIGAHFDFVDKFSPAERPNATSTYTHKLNFELDVGVALFHRVPLEWLRSVEVEASLDYVATGLPRAGDVLPVSGERYLDNASPWSLSLVLVVPIAPLGR